MHYRLELILPPTQNIEEDVKTILAPWSESYEDESGDKNDHGFYDWYQIGGRYSGSKVEQMLGQEKIDAFVQVLRDNNITISGLIWGKETLNPASQADLVNKLWNEFFPDAPVKVCPLFDNYKETFGDVMSVKDLTDDMTAARVVVATPDYDEKTLEIKTMLSGSLWNGVDHQETTWDKKILSAIKKHNKEYDGCTDEEYKKKRVVGDDWLCVTIDYHS